MRPNFSAYFILHEIVSGANKTVFRAQDKNPPKIKYLCPKPATLQNQLESIFVLLDLH